MLSGSLSRYSVTPLIGSARHPLGGQRAQGSSGRWAGDRDGGDWDDDDFEAPVDVCRVAIVLPDGRQHQVSVDMTDGSVLGNRLDD